MTPSTVYRSTNPPSVSATSVVDTLGEDACAVFISP
jgi:hypothetical protein